MSTTMKRIMLSIPDEVENKIDQLKQEHFYDKSYAEVYRQIIIMGLAAMKDCGKKNEHSV